MGNFYNIPSAKTSGDFMYRCGNECSGIDHAAALYEQVCVPNDRGYTPLNEDFVLGIRQLIMPVIVLALSHTASITRQTRSAMLEVISSDYIRTARSKGLKEKKVILGHALRNALIPIVTLLGMSVGGLIGGTVLIEQLFSIPGVGSLMMTAILNKDYMVVQNVVFIIALFVMVCNLLVDILYGYIDPRIRVD